MKEQEMNRSQTFTGSRRTALNVGLIGLAVAVGLVAAAAFGGRGSAALGAPAPSTAPSATPMVTSAPATSSAQPSARPTAEPTEPGKDAMPIKVDLVNVGNDDVYVDIVDLSGTLEDATSGAPGDGASVERFTLKVENIDATTLRLTWVDYSIDAALALYIDEDAHRFVLVQPDPTVPVDLMVQDRVLILTFSEPISADQVEAFLQGGLDTSG
jgi:hypothetical protein